MFFPYDIVFSSEKLAGYLCALQYEKYDTIIASQNKLEFKFESFGPKGTIKMVVQFTATLNKDIYNLAFGIFNSDGSIDDKTINDNKDRNKILATVAATVYEFTAQYPDKTVFFCGSTPERTRLYRIALALNLGELGKHFQIYGVIKKIDGYEQVLFKKSTYYLGFMVKRKKVKFVS